MELTHCLTAQRAPSLNKAIRPMRLHFSPGTPRRFIRQLFWVLSLTLAAAVHGTALPAPRTAAAAGQWVHGYAAFGEPKYPRGFDNFDYTNPQAPKGGTLYLRNPDPRTSFDKFNYFTLRGHAPGALALFMLEPLATLAGDETQTMYGLLAQEMRIAPDKSSITFRLHPQARFYNGDPVTTADVLYSFQSQSGKYASPGYQAALGCVERATVLDERTIRFDLRDHTTDALFTVGGLRVFSRKWAVQADGQPKRFDEIVSEYPITSGPYTIAVADSGRRLELKRNPDYWAQNLGVRRGFYNFDRIVYRYYKDAAIAREAFKAGEFDIYKEYGARSWMRQHKGPKWDDGRIKKERFETQIGKGMQSFQLNLRRPLLQDARVRQALSYAYDFDTESNRYGLFKQAHSVYNNSEFAAVGLPGPGELQLLEPFRQVLPPEVFGPAYQGPTTGRDPQRLRRNLLRARALLEQAGWQLAQDGRLRNAQGEPLQLEYLTVGQPGRIANWQDNLEKLGITLTERVVDYALFNQRLQAYDFDVVMIVEGWFTLPDASSIRNGYGSQSADEKGGGNYRGVKSPLVDHLANVMAVATTLEQLRDASRALDRVVMWNHWQVPDLYGTSEMASYWDRFGMPTQRPQYFTIEYPDSDMIAWPISTWWLKPKATQ
jgi:microcin C transport system substrate-binding protein